MFGFIDREINRVENLLKVGADKRTEDISFLEREIMRFKGSRQRRMMTLGCLYYEGKQAILRRKRTVIGEDGEPEEITNLPNNRIVDNQYKKAVLQKANYLLGKPFSIQCENKTYGDLLNEIFDRDFQRLIKNTYKDSLNCGIGWVYVNYSESGELRFTRFKPYESLPIWADDEHTELECFIRLYTIVDYSGNMEEVKEKAEVYTREGISYYDLEGGSLKKTGTAAYFYDGDELGYGWGKIPIIGFKYNNDELPLIRRVKSLQDALNLLLSNFQNNMEEDIRNTILVIKNYEGENLGEFRQNLSQYGAIKVRSFDGCDAGVEALRIEVNSANYQTIIDMIRKAIIENAMSYDAKDDRIGANANQLNIRSMYSDIDLDANETEGEFQAAFEKLIGLINIHFANTGRGNFENEKVEIIFDRDVLINESETIDNCQKSAGILSRETIVAQHPWVTDAAAELERLKLEEEEAARTEQQDLYAGQMPSGDDES